MSKDDKKAEEIVPKKTLKNATKTSQKYVKCRQKATKTLEEKTLKKHCPKTQKEAKNELPERRQKR